MITKVEMHAHALDRKRGPALERRTEKEGTKHTADSWSKDLKWRVLKERSGNSDTLQKLHKEKWTTRNLSQGGHRLKQEKRGSGKSRGGRRGQREVELRSACHFSP